MDEETNVTERNECIRKQYADGLSYSAIGKDFGLSKSMVIKICAGDRSDKQKIVEGSPVCEESIKGSPVCEESIKGSPTCEKPVTKIITGVKENSLRGSPTCEEGIQKTNTPKLSKDEQSVYDYLRKISPMVANRKHLQEACPNTDIDKVVSSLQSKVNKGFTKAGMYLNYQVYEGESIDELCCNMYRYRDWSITGE